MSDDDVARIMEQSYTFRSLTAQLIGELQRELAEKVNPTEEQLIENLRRYIKVNANPNNKIAHIKYVRQYAQDHEKLLPNNFQELYSLMGAKKFVEYHMGEWH